MKTIWFDMDGTIADLYGYDNWLPLLRAESVEPYVNARPLLNMSALAKTLHSLEKYGFTFGVISWGARGGSAEYTKQVGYAKVEWLQKHLPSVDFQQIIVVEYGTSKAEFADDSDILIDDDNTNREEWESTLTNGMAFDEKEILKNLRFLRMVCSSIWGGKK